MASQFCLRPVRAGLLVAAALAPVWVMAQPGHDASAARPWRYGASVEGHVPALPQVVRDAVRQGGSIDIEVDLFAFATLAFEASFDPYDSRWGMSADIAAPAGAGRGAREDPRELPEDLPAFWDVYFGSRSWLARCHARLQAIVGKVFRAPGSRTPAFGAFFPTLH